MILVYYISLLHMNTLVRLITRPFDETLRSLLPSYLDPIWDDSISSASSFWVRERPLFDSKVQKILGSAEIPDLIHDELDHRAMVPCLVSKFRI